MTHPGSAVHQVIRFEVERELSRDVVCYHGRVRREYTRHRPLWA